MFQRLLIAVAVAALLAAPLHAESLPQPLPPQKQQGLTAKEALTDAAIIALTIAASIVAYKAMGKPCACPDDTTRSGRRCGGNSAYSRGGGHKPLCYPTDITAAMISAYRATKAIPSLR
jgi:hypothetical protein